MGMKNLEFGGAKEFNRTFFYPIFSILILNTKFQILDSNLDVAQ